MANELGKVMKWNYKNRYLAFTLIELSVVMVIIALILGVMVTVVPSEANKDATKETQDKMKVIEDSLLSFFNEKSYIPCPASRTAALSTATFGADSTCNGAAPAGTVDVGSGAERVRIGAVPTRELGLPDSYAFDGWNNRITYAVGAELAYSSVGYTNHTPTTTGFTVIDNAGNQMHTGLPTFIAYVLVSHGADGSGAYSYQGVAPSGATACSGTRRDGENCNDNATFRDQFQDIRSANAFDDIIKWRTKSYTNITGLSTTIALKSGSASVKYGRWEYQASGVTNLPKAGTPQSWVQRTLPTQVVNNTEGVTATSTQVTFKANKTYYIREGHMACGTGATQFTRYITPAYILSTNFSTVDFLDTAATNKPCVWLTSVGHFAPTADTVTEAWMWSTQAEATLGGGRGWNPGASEQYVFSRLEVWER